MIGIFEIEPTAMAHATAPARHWTEEAMTQYQDMGFELGWGAVADKLQALCESE